MSNFNAWGERGYTSTFVMPDEHTDISARKSIFNGEVTGATLDIGSVQIKLTTEICDRIHEAITQAYEILEPQQVTA